MRNLEAFGCGAAFFDYDDDGWMDILLVASPNVRVYHNRKGVFEETTGALGLDRSAGPWAGVSVGDFNGDGRLDLVLTGYRRLALLRNEGGAKFVDVTARAGLDPGNHGHWGSGTALMDLDGDGWLDLLILNYVVFGPREIQYCEVTPGVKSGCPPDKYRPEFAEIWKNTDGNFVDVSLKSGIRNTHGKALVSAFADVDLDGRIDFYIGNDGTPAEFMHNRGAMRFENIGEDCGLAVTPMGHALAAMGADWADFDRDGRLDLTVTGFSDEPFLVVRNTGRLLFEQRGDELGISGPTSKPLGFGAKWLDFDNDGWPDISYVNGHVYDNNEMIDPLSTYRQPIMLFHSLQGKEFKDLIPELGPELRRPLVGRGSATGDFDNDGRIDILVIDYEGAPMLLHNTSRAAKHWVTLDLHAKAPNSYAYGAHVTATAGKQVWVADLAPASSYLSSSDPRIHFGLGAVEKLDAVKVRWPNGSVETFRDVGGDQITRLQQGGSAQSRRGGPL